MSSVGGRHPRLRTGVAALLASLALVTGVAGCSGGGSSDGASSAPTVSAAPAVAGSAVPLAESLPLRVEIPAIGVDSELIDLGLQDDGTMEVPEGGFPAGWYVNAPTPGELGPAIIAGHVDMGGKPGVFYDLRDLKPGDEISVTRADGSIPVFRVTEVQQYPKDEFPTTTVYGDIDHAGLRVITCGGDFDSSARSYVDNIVVYAELVEARSL